MQGLRGQLLQQLVVVVNTLSCILSTRRTFKCRNSGQFCYLYNLLNTDQVHRQYKLLVVIVMNTMSQV